MIFKEVNATTGEVTEREATEAEAREIEQSLRANDEIIEKVKQGRESAKAKLTALGLDEAEVQAILGL